MNEGVPQSIWLNEEAREALKPLVNEYGEMGMSWSDLIVKISEKISKKEKN